MNEPPTFLDVPVIYTRFPQQRSLIALQNILVALPGPRGLLVSSDHDVPSSAVCHLLWEYRPDAEITVLADANCHLSPLPGVYARTLLSTIERCLAAGREDLHALFCTTHGLSIVGWNKWRMLDAA